MITPSPEEGGGGNSYIVSSAGTWNGKAPVLSHFTFKLGMQKASFTFKMPTKFIPYFMAMVVSDNISISFCKAMPLP